MRVRTVLGVMPALLVACASSAPVTLPLAPLDPPPSYAEGVDDRVLAETIEAYWAWVLESHPEFATRLGDSRYDDRLTDVRWEAVQERARIAAAFADRVQAMAPAALSERDQVTRTLLIESLRSDVAAQVCRFPLWSLSPRGNPITDLNYLPKAQPIDDADRFSRLLDRYAAGAVQVDQTIDNLQLGARKGWYANRESTRRVLEMVDAQLALPVEQWPMWLERPDGVDPARWPGLVERMKRILDEEVKPALVRYRRLLAEQILPRSRTEQVGLTGLAFGEACYAARIRSYTTLETTAKKVHETGLAEIERINREMVEIGQGLFGTSELSEILKRLRSDPGLRFNTEVEVLAKAQSALERARSVLPAFFGRLPEADCVVRKIPGYEAPFTTVAYYRQPVPDGSRPGEYYVNTYQPETRTRYEAEALAYHESIPGHHLQIAIQQELSGIPDFRKHAGMTAFVEGWALYAEHLAGEMGLYSSDLDRMGKLSYEAWRAARLVVDTGIHAMGWSRQQAQDFMTEHTALAANNIDNEVDRYIVWPGQALAYKTGQMEILRLRTEAEGRLGDRFSIEAFHDAVLLGGAVTLPILQDQVKSYIESAERGR